MKAFRPLVVLSLAVALAAPSTTWADGPPPSEPLARTGLGAGLVIAPTFNASAPIFLGAVGVFELDVAGSGPVGFNLCAQFGGGVIPVSVTSDVGAIGTRTGTVGLGALLLTPELRLRFTPMFSSGLGVTLGPVFASDGTGFWLGPNVTLLAARFAVHHQVTVGLAPLFQLTGTVGFATLLPSLRYTYLF